MFFQLKVLDGHSAHKSDAVKEWVNQYHGRVFIHFLPASSSVLNPIVSNAGLHLYLYCLGALLGNHQNRICQDFDRRIAKPKCES
jgi:hypothetical protein